VKNGQTYDASQTVGFQKFATKMMEFCPDIYDWLMDKRIKMLSDEGFPGALKEWNFKPAPPVYLSFFFIGDKLYPLMMSGFAKPVSGVRKVTGPKSIELTNGTILEDIDTIIYCTGYDAHIPFLRPEFNPFPGDGISTNLFRGTFLIHPDPWVRSSLAFVGHAAVLVPGFQMFELAGVAISQTWLGSHPVASFEEMKEWEGMYNKWRNKMRDKNPLQATQYLYAMPFADHLRWLDRTTGADVMSHFGWGYKAWKFWWNDRKFYNLCKNGIWSPAVWRLFQSEGRKSWGGAKEQIYKDNELFKRQTEMRREYVRKMEKEESGKST
jgi:dimethylaniline monooxygenase (N-oxide forming)